MTAEERRLKESHERKFHWKRWGPYLSERAWGTVREDYSKDGAAWEYFPHDHARSRAYRWTEDGIAGICDRHQKICFSVAFWNGKDPILKERLFGLTGNQGNHGEDVKECYYYLDSTPTHSYMKYLYKYPQAAFPYTQLVEENRKRGRRDPEFELEDTGIFNENRYFDIFVEYAKQNPEDILIRITVVNRGPERAELHLLPTTWFRNNWSWGRKKPRPQLKGVSPCTIELDDPYYGKRWLMIEGPCALLYTENETNFPKLYNVPGNSPFTKDGINDFLIEGDHDAINPDEQGTKAAMHYRFQLAPGESTVVRLRLSDKILSDGAFGTVFEDIFQQRIKEANEFYAGVIPPCLSEDEKNVTRQAFAGLLWSKQFYHYVVKDWLDGDPSYPPPPASRKRGRNHDWIHLYNADVISMPDKWEYPWYAAWDLAFHCLPLALVDPDFAKEQLVLMTREWYQHPNGQLPAYEWAFGDVNPPVQAWAAWRVYKIEKKRTGRGDTIFLERMFHKLMLNFTWWVNRKDPEGHNVFQGGFLGLDNIGVFNRDAPLPTGGFLGQADGTGWMAMFSLNMLAIALELANFNPAYEDVASKFWEHFLYIANAITHLGHDGVGMWCEEDGFFYDVLLTPEGSHKALTIRSMVGLVPLFAVQTLEPGTVDRFPGFKRRLEWFVEHRKDLSANVACMKTPGSGERRLMSIINGERLRRVLRILFDENEFLSPYGIRSLSRIHEEYPFVMHVDGLEYRVDYDPVDSTSGLFGGNSNWRGPIWFPVNYLIIESLQKFHHYLGLSYTIEYPTGSGKYLPLCDIATDLSRRLASLFQRDSNGRRPAHGENTAYQSDPHWKDLVLFYEFFHGDNGAGHGANHQTGWTGLVAKLLQQCGG
jgi:Glycosyl hydrolase family 63 C-terminal domain